LDQEPYAVHVEGAFERPRGPKIVVSVVLVAVLLAVVKPWSFGGSGAPEARSSSRPSAAPAVVTSAAPAPSPQVDPNGMLCLGGDVEQVVAYERSDKVEVRNWIAIDDVPATGPLDPQMAQVKIFSSRVVGLGICGRYAGAGVPVAGLIVDVQLLTRGTKETLAKDLGRPRQITRELGGQDAAVLYGSPQEIVVLPDPPDDATRPSADTEPPTLRPWSTATYAIAFAFAADGPGVVHWLRLELAAGVGEPTAATSGREALYRVVSSN
jgi:hypothetical protein